MKNKGSEYIYRSKCKKALKTAAYFFLLPPFLCPHTWLLDIENATQAAYTPCMAHTITGFKEPLWYQLPYYHGTTYHPSWSKTRKCSTYVFKNMPKESKQKADQPF